MTSSDNKRWVPVTNVDQLPEHSRYRKFKAGLSELQSLNATEAEKMNFVYQASKHCFLAFASLMLDGNLKTSPFHELVGCAFEDIANGHTERFILSCPPRSGKSLFSQLLVAWLLGKDPTTEHIIASYGAKLSGQFYAHAIKFLKHSEFKKVFPSWKGFRADSKYDMLNGGALNKTSVGGPLTGFTAGSKSPDSDGVGTLIIDDPLKNGHDGAMLTRLRDWWGDEASTRRTNRWAQILIGTRFHVSDLHGILMETDGGWDPKDNPEGWRWLNIPGLCENPALDPLNRKVGETHWPENPIFTVNKLNSQKRAMGSNRFSALYQGKPIAAEGSIIQEEWLEIIDESQAPEFDTTYLAIDTAYKEKQEADESVIAILGHSKSNHDKIYLRGMVHGRWSFPDLISIVKDTRQKWNAQFMCIEDAASGQSLIQVLERDTKTYIHKYKPTRSKTVRLQAVAPLFEAHRVFFIKESYTDSFIQELLNFPRSPHDDRTDAMVWGLQYFMLDFNPVSKDLLNTIQTQNSHKNTRSCFGEFRTYKKRQNNLKSHCGEISAFRRRFE